MKINPAGVQMTTANLPTLDDAIGPALGIYYDIPAETYHRWPLPSNSILGHLARSPAHAREAMDKPKQQTAAMKLGTALHSLVLEPIDYAESYIVGEKCCAIKKSDGNACDNDGIIRSSGLWYCGTHGKGKPAEACKTIITAEDHSKVCGMSDGILSNPNISRLLRYPSHSEVSIVFTDTITGVTARMRADRICVLPSGQRVILDIKTTEDASPEGFAKSIYNYGYHRQAAMYLRGAASAGIACEAFVFVAVESSPPYACMGHRIGDASLEIGNAEVTRLLKLYDECERAGVWPGYSEKIEYVELPDWVMRREGAFSNE